MLNGYVLEAGLLEDAYITAGCVARLILVLKYFSSALWLKEPIRLQAT